MELKETTFTCYKEITEQTICQEETLETIVPDACPDILRIINVCGQVLLGGKQVEDGRATINGTIAATVLYQPEDATGICRMDVHIPFVVKQEIASLTSSSTIHVSTRLQNADARVLNPRKVLVRADLIVDLAAFQEIQHTVYNGADLEENCDLCQKQNQIECIQLIDLPERIFPISDEIRFQHSDAIPTLLSCHASARSTEERLIGNKLIFKGNIDLDLLFSDSDGILSQRKESLPFSQILEIPEIEEPSNSQIMIEIMSVSYIPDLEEDGRIRLELDLLAQAQIRSTRHATLLTDIYSTTHDMDTSQTKFDFCCFHQPSVCSKNIRTLLETEELVRSIADTQVLFSTITQHREGGKLILSSKCKIQVLYLDETQKLRSIQKDAPLQIELECDSDTSCCTCKIIPGEIFALPAAGGIEFRLNVDLLCFLNRYDSINMISGASIGSLRSSDGVRPSVVLRLADADETLWDIAKIYGTTVQRILQANELEESASYHDEMLLIPSGR